MIYVASNFPGKWLCNLKCIMCSLVEKSLGNDYYQSGISCTSTLKLIVHFTGRRMDLVMIVLQQSQLSGPKVNHIYCTLYVVGSTTTIIVHTCICTFMHM